MSVCDATSVYSSILTVRIRILLSLFPIFTIGLGANHIYDCPKQPMVPIYLLVGGMICLIIQILPCLFCSKDILMCQILRFLLFVCSLIWLLTGSIFVYMAYEPKYNFRLSADYCDRTVYKFAFWITNAIYIYILITLLKLCCCQLQTLCTKRAQRKCYVKTIT